MQLIRDLTTCITLTMAEPVTFHPLALVRCGVCDFVSVAGPNVAGTSRQFFIM